MVFGSLSSEEIFFCTEIKTPFENKNRLFFEFFFDCSVSGVKIEVLLPTYWICSSIFKPFQKLKKQIALKTTPFCLEKPPFYLPLHKNNAKIGFWQKNWPYRYLFSWKNLMCSLLINQGRDRLGYMKHPVYLLKVQKQCSYILAVASKLQIWYHLFSVTCGDKENWLISTR